jgi:hypothetical protein
MDSVPAGDRAAQVEAIVAAIRDGGLFAADVEIIPAKIGEACHVLLPAATQGEMSGCSGATPGGEDSRPSIGMDGPRPDSFRPRAADPACGARPR